MRSKGAWVVKLDLHNGTPMERPKCQSVLHCDACIERMAELTAFENAYFGATFAWTLEQNRHWTDCSAAIHAAITQGDADDRIVASISVQLAESNSCRRLIADEITECELQPWSITPGCHFPIL